MKTTSNSPVVNLHGIRYFRHNEFAVERLTRHLETRPGSLLEAHVIAGAVGCNLGEAQEFMLRLVTQGLAKPMRKFYHIDCDENDPPPFLISSEEILTLPVVCDLCGDTIIRRDEFYHEDMVSVIHRPRLICEKIMRPKSLRGRKYIHLISVPKGEGTKEYHVESQNTIEVVGDDGEKHIESLPMTQQDIERFRGVQELLIDLEMHGRDAFGADEARQIARKGREQRDKLGIPVPGDWGTEKDSHEALLDALSHYASSKAIIRERNESMVESSGGHYDPADFMAEVDAVDLSLIRQDLRRAFRVWEIVDRPLFRSWLEGKVGEAIAGNYEETGMLQELLRIIDYPGRDD